jgi:hypothetical protein
MSKEVLNVLILEYSIKEFSINENIELIINIIIIYLDQKDL